jgi:UDPglucose 6-dehydrogenase
MSHEHGVSAPVIESVLPSNALHQNWARDRVLDLLSGIDAPRVALLGLTYKPGTDTLRRSSSVELGQWLSARGITVVAYDPAIRELPPELHSMQLASSVADALDGTDVAVLATPWPEFAQLTPEVLVQHMRQQRLVDQAGFLTQLGEDERITYVRVGRPRSSAVPVSL